MSEESGIERTSRARAARSSTARVSVEPGVGSASAPQVRRHRGLSEPALDSPERFFNRELSWLDFNFRVMEESANPGHPLLERLRFLSISASNLDEFFMVRYAGLREQMAQGLNRPAQDGLNPAEQVDRVRTVSKQLMAEQEGRWRELRRELRTAGIELVSPDELDAADRLAIHGHFERELFPITTPMSVDPAHPFPFIPNLGFAIAYALEGDEDHPGKRLTGLVPLPSQIARFVRLPEDDPARVRYLPVEDIFTLFVSELFPGFVARGACQFRVIRDSDIEIEEEAEDLIREFESLLKERRRGRIVRVKINNRGEPWLRDMIVRELEADPGDVVDAGDLLGLAQLSQLITDERRDLQFTPYEPRFPERVRQFGGDIFACVRHKDMVVHHPYESFDVVVQFLRQAARDPAVVAIKQTLYRTSRNSPIVAALIEAAEAGKNVTALVEIKARFDEEANLRLARDLEHAGAKVVYGFIDYKTHAKVSLVVRREDGELRNYTHFGTGNYHPFTARIYTDLSLFTADPALGRDANRLFNLITANRTLPRQAPGFERLGVSPLTLQPTLISLIEAEAENARAGKPSGIWAKMNALVDEDAIDALYRASQAGVPIALVVRGICCLRPGIKGLSETIRVKSIVGRFLEHARVVCFANGHRLPSDRALVFISSADWMQRNLKRRVETLVPVLNPTVHNQIVDQVMVANLNDDLQSWELDAEGNYRRMKPPGKGEGFSAHEYFMSHHSLSGVGGAVGVPAPPPLRLRRSAPGASW